MVHFVQIAAILQHHLFTPNQEIPLPDVGRSEFLELSQYLGASGDMCLRVFNKPGGILMVVDLNPAFCIRSLCCFVGFLVLKPGCNLLHHRLCCLGLIIGSELEP